MMAFFLAPPLKVRLRGCGGRAAQCARSRTRTRMVIMGSRRRRQRSCPPAELHSLFGKLRQCIKLRFDRTPCGSRRLVRGDRRATARGEGCEGLDGSAPPRPLEAPSLVVHSAKGCPPTNARAHTRTTRTRPGQEASSRRPRSVAAPTGHQYHGGAP